MFVSLEVNIRWETYSWPNNAKCIESVTIQVSIGLELVTIWQAWSSKLIVVYAQVKGSQHKKL